MLIQKNPGTYYEVCEPGSARVRLECLYLHDAEHFATNVYRAENTVCEISEVTRLASPLSGHV
jgi:hypothetical protein